MIFWNRTNNDHHHHLTASSWWLNAPIAPNATLFLWICGFDPTPFFAKHPTTHMLRLMVSCPFGRDGGAPVTTTFNLFWTHLTSWLAISCYFYGSWHQLELFSLSVQVVGCFNPSDKDPSISQAFQVLGKIQKSPSNHRSVKLWLTIRSLAQPVALLAGNWARPQSMGMSHPGDDELAIKLRNHKG